MSAVVAKRVRGSPTPDERIERESRPSLEIDRAQRADAGSPCVRDAHETVVIAVTWQAVTRLSDSRYASYRRDSAVSSARRTEIATCESHDVRRHEKSSVVVVVVIATRVRNCVQ